MNQTKSIFLFLLIVLTACSQNTTVESLQNVIKEKDIIIDSLNNELASSETQIKDMLIDSLNRELALLKIKNPDEQRTNYCFLRFDKRFFRQTGSNSETVNSFKFTLNGKTFPITKDTLFIRVNPTGLDTLVFESKDKSYTTLLKLHAKEFYVISYNECVNAYLINKNKRSKRSEKSGVIYYFNGDYKNNEIVGNLQSHIQDTTVQLKPQQISHRLTPIYDMCINTPRTIAIKNLTTGKTYTSFYFTFIDNERLRVNYYERSDITNIVVESND